MKILLYKPNHCIFLFLILLTVALWSHTALAVDRYVDSVAGVNVPLCTDPVNPCQEIGHAISESVAGDRIYLISVSGNPITFLESDLVISFDLSVIGEGPFRTTIDAQDVDRIFSITGGQVLIDGVTLTNGNAGFNNGGAIELLGGDLLISRSRATNNQSSFGGAIAAPQGSGSVTVVASVMRGNLATGSGGVIWCDSCSDVNVLFSRLVNNVTGGLGGAIYAFGTRAVVSFSHLSRNNADSGGAIYGNFAEVHVLNSELTGNDADTLDGGAINIGGDLNIERSALTENSATGAGGAVHMVGEGDFVSANTTFSGNTAMWGGALSLTSGIGPGPNVIIGTATFVNNESTFPGTAEHIFGFLGSVELYNSIIANDLSGGAIFDPYCSAGLADGQHNLIDDSSCDTGVATFNLGTGTGLDFNLAYNGGVTRTHLPTAISNVIDAGRNAACLNPATRAPLVVDQRGRSRPVDFDGNGVAECDIGAIELN